MLRRAPRSETGNILPGYTDFSEIGGGAFATVYRAVEIETGRPVALKVLKVDAVHGRLVETFTNEVRALAQVSDHPNIVTLYRTLTTPDGRPVLVLELCRESMAQRLRRTGPVGAQEATRIAIKVAGALETAHRHGFLHRDLKPQNILVTQFGEPALSDFGVAALQTTAQATAGLIGFTTLHAAPEALEGNLLSPATDVYGLASSLYQLLSGLAPFTAYEDEAPASVILRIIRDPVRPVRAEGVPLDLADVLESALAKQPGARPRTAADFADALLRVQAANDWPPTTFVAWGAESSPPAPGPDVPARRGAPPAPGPDTGAQSRPPSPVPASSTAPVGSMAPPGDVPAPPVRITEVEAPRPAVGSHPGSDPPGQSAAAALDRPGDSRERSSGAGARPLPTWVAAPPPPPPPPPPARPGPSVASPSGGIRQVVPPGQVRRGNPRPTVSSTANPPLAPLPSPSVASRSRPVFVDPPGPAAGGADGAAPESPYEQTVLPIAHVLDLARRPSRPAAGASGRPVPVLWLAGVVAGIIVLIAALLLVAGVL